jgi:hypothetical protein
MIFEPLKGQRAMGAKPVALFCCKEMKEGKP